MRLEDADAARSLSEIAHENRDLIGLIDLDVLENDLARHDFDGRPSGELLEPSRSVERFIEIHVN